MFHPNIITHVETGILCICLFILGILIFKPIILLFKYTSNIFRTIQAFQSISLRLVTSASWYISNDTLHNYLNIETISQLASKHYSKFHSKLSTHSNPKISSLSCKTFPGNPIRRLKRKWCRGLLK
ncbi:zinc finger MYM-type protein 6-like [Aphis craccivora]|uniref:Zinc finger MYM-type protein 6-like n=1 Tax=Aphis craccivora TaxID=307492 RepID=A0A6G0ZHQ1_APHCR|nr:zinc finger MYM-type protein 6-like [Aphis craccivora]